MYSLEEKVFWSALLSRIFVIFLSFLSNEFIPDHDPEVFRTPAASENFTVFDNVVHRIFGGLLRWDAQYFIHIARYGYTYEKSLAFFPLFPFITKVLSAIVYYFVSSVLNYSSVTLLCAVLLNVYFFVKAAGALYRLTLNIFNDQHLAYKSAILFTINPASIFFTAPYSESSFAFFTFTALLLGTENKLNESSIFTGLSIATRSNGILNIGFIVYRHLKYVLPQYKNSVRGFLLHFVLLIVRILVSCASFVMFQVYGYFKFCFLYSSDDFAENVIAYGEENDFVIAGRGVSPWCRSAIPVPYLYIQKYYWQVGFLKYYEWKQLPNFLLATPLVCIIIYNSCKYLKENIRSICSLGLRNKYFRNSSDSRQFEYIVHVLSLTIFCVFCIHVQVTTRMVLSSSPVLYWIVARAFKSRQKSKFMPLEKQLYKVSATNKKVYEIESAENMNSLFKTFMLTGSCENSQQKFVKLYFIMYVIIGTGLFSNYYPWT